MTDMRTASGLNDEGISSTLFYCGLLVAAGILLALISYLQPFAPEWWNLITDDAVAHAETAKHLARGQGFTTGWIFPNALNYAHDVNRVPDLYNPPLYSLILGFFFLLLGANLPAIIVCTTVLFVGTGVCIFLFAKDAFGQYAALIAALLFLTNPIMRLTVAEGESLVLLVFLTNALFWLVYTSRMNSPGANAAIGALAGLCYLTEYMYWIMMLPLCLFCVWSSKGQRGKNLLALFAGFCAVSWWWWLRNCVVTGNPFFTFRFYNSSAERYLGMHGGRIVTGALKPAIRGGAGSINTGIVAINLKRQASELILTFGNWLGPLFVAAAFWKCGNEKMQTARKVMYGVALVVWLFVGGWSRYFTKGLCFLPFVCIIVAGFISSLLTADRSRRPLVRVAVLAVLVGASLISLPYWVRVAGSPLDVRYLFLAKVPRERVIVSDWAMRIAWLLDRPSVELPLERKDCIRVMAALPGGAAVYLSPDVESEYVRSGLTTFWRDVVSAAQEGHVSAELPFKHGEFIEDNDYLFY